MTLVIELLAMGADYAFGLIADEIIGNQKKDIRQKVSDKIKSIIKSSFESNDTIHFLGKAYLNYNELKPWSDEIQKTRLSLVEYIKEEKVYQSIMDYKSIYYPNYPEAKIKSASHTIWIEICEGLNKDQETSAFISQLETALSEKKFKETMLHAAKQIDGLAGKTVDNILDSSAPYMSISQINEIINLNIQSVSASHTKPYGIAKYAKRFYADNRFIPPRLFVDDKAIFDQSMNNENTTAYTQDEIDNCFRSFDDIEGFNIRWLIGDAGNGKSFFLKKYFLTRNKQFLNRTSNNAVLFIEAKDLYAMHILKKKRGKLLDSIYNLMVKNCLDKEHYTIIIDGIDEALRATPQDLVEFISFIQNQNCIIWLGCRSSYFKLHQRLFETVNSIVCEISEWDERRINAYADLYIGDTNAELSSSFLITKRNEDFHSILANPLHLLMLLFILENESKPILGSINDYQFYEKFIYHLLKNESSYIGGNESFLEEDIQRFYRESYTIARKMYDSPDETITCSPNDKLLLSVLVFDYMHDDVIIIRRFYHSTILEYIISHETIKAIQLRDQEKNDCLLLIDALKHNNRKDVDKFIVHGFKTLNKIERCQIVNNLFEGYQAVKHYDNLTSQEAFYVRNQSVYYMTRIENVDNDRVKEYIKIIYKSTTSLQETEREKAIMRQGIAYGAANIGLYDIALDFAKRMEPGSTEDQVNRAWTLVFYGDKAEEDPLDYRDEQKCDWKNSRERRLKRFRSVKSKDKAFRMFDLCIMFGFYTSRDWADVNPKDLATIEQTVIDFEDYPNDVLLFLREKKDLLVNTYRQKLSEKKSLER